MTPSDMVKRSRQIVDEVGDRAMRTIETDEWYSVFTVVYRHTVSRYLL